MVNKHFLYKALLILVVTLLSNCIVKDPDPTEIDFNKAELVGIDNSGQYTNANIPVDTMYADAVALKLVLYDTNFLYNKIKMSIDDTYIPVDKVKNIQIITLMDLAPSIRAGDDVTSLFLCMKDNFELYSHLRNGIDRLNEKSTTPYSELLLLLKNTVENTKAQFQFKISFESGKELIAVSNIITIL